MSDYLGRSIYSSIRALIFMFTIEQSLGVLEPNTRHYIAIHIRNIGRFEVTCRDLDWKLNCTATPLTSSACCLLSTTHCFTVLPVPKRNRPIKDQKPKEKETKEKTE